MKLQIRNRCSDFNGYRAALCKSLFNAETGCNFDLDADLPLDTVPGWKIGLVVGPSGSGKTSIGRQIFGGERFQDDRWPADLPIVEAIAPDGSFDSVTGALASVGLGNVPAWLRPYHALSNGEQFRARLARAVCEAPAEIVIDEFSSVVDRQIAKVGAGAFAKAWRRTPGRAVLLSCHYDVIEWLQPDWVYDTATGKFNSNCLCRRPPIEVEVRQTGWEYWSLFEPHHYLKIPRMIAATCFVAFVEGAPVAHLAVSPRFEIGNSVRACRMVVMPEWQGAGVGMRFLNYVCERYRRGLNKWGRRCATYFHTSHPGLAAALRRDRLWRQVPASLGGGNKEKSRATIVASQQKHGKKNADVVSAGYGGHLRAVQGFKYMGRARV